MFARIEISMEKKHLLNIPRVVAYKVYTGSYMARFGNLSRLRKLAPYSDTIGIYYDNPQNKCGDQMSLEDLVRRLEGADYKLFLIRGSDPEEEGDHNSESAPHSKATIMEAVPMVSSAIPLVTCVPNILPSWRGIAAMRRYIRAQLLQVKPFIEYYRKSQGTVHFLVPSGGNSVPFFIPDFRDDNDGQVGADTYQELLERENLETEHRDRQTTSV
ncbi:uncharacterized protein LOC142352303 [Convolutriloba macropyga]|uniref:uncharacterized protein LOC142352303 n=1 Tax=Convolutriloba macropyga TaxID=536237 RepID=UPI003F523052